MPLLVIIFVLFSFQIKVQDINDHCPIITNATSAYFNPVPMLRVASLLNITATDFDSGLNGDIAYKVSEVKEIV